MHNVLDMHSAWGAQKLHEARSMDDGQWRKSNVVGAAFGCISYDRIPLDLQADHSVTASAECNTRGNVRAGHGK